MLYLRVLILISAISLFINTNSFSQRGCVRQGQNSGNPLIYIDLMPGYTTRFNFTGNDVTYNSNPPLATCTDFYVSRGSFGALGSCGIYSGSTRVYNGYLVNYVVRCPLDDYIPHLLLASGSFGFIILRKRNLLKIA